MWWWLLLFGDVGVILGLIGVAVTWGARDPAMLVRREALRDAGGEGAVREVEMLRGLLSAERKGNAEEAH
jgi:hypothetical protein